MRATRQPPGWLQPLSPPVDHETLLVDACSRIRSSFSDKKGLVFMSEAEERYERAVAILSDALKFGIHPSLDGIQMMMEKMGNPHLKYRAVQVAGTNGKTSTTRQITALLRAHGYRTGLYTSPHLVEYPARPEGESL